jgi:hypothetical protein
VELDGADHGETESPCDEGLEAAMAKRQSIHAVTHVAVADARGLDETDEHATGHDSGRAGNKGRAKQHGAGQHARFGQRAAHHRRSYDRGRACKQTGERDHDDRIQPLATVCDSCDHSVDRHAVLPRHNQVQPGAALFADATIVVSMALPVRRTGRVGMANGKVFGGLRIVGEMPAISAI